LVPGPGFVGEGHVTPVARTISHIDEAIVREPDLDRSVRDIVDVLRANGHQAVDVGYLRTRHEVELERIKCWHRRLYASPTVARTQRGSRVRVETRQPRRVADFSTACADENDGRAQTKKAPLGHGYPLRLFIASKAVLSGSDLHRFTKKCTFKDEYDRSRR
jgi:hypothetical protein